MKMRVSDYIAKFIYDVGVRHVFTVSGGGVMYLDDAVVCHKKLHYICNHHEQASAFAAESYSRVTQNFGVALVTSGPGATNAITGVFEAWVDSSPMMVISGQSKRKETIHNAKIDGLRQFGLFEVDIVPMIKNITKFSVMINDADKIRYNLEKAYYLATTGRTGPVWIDIPLDIQGAIIDSEKLVGFTPESKKETKSVALQLDKLIRLLQSSRKPLIIAGNGIRLSRGIPEFLQLVKELKIPVVTSIMGTDLIEEKNRYYVGRVGLRGTRSGNFAVQNADLIISIGSRLSIPVIGYEYKKFAPNAKKIVIDIDSAEHKKNTIAIDLLINSDAKDMMNKIITHTKNLSFNFKKEWVKKCKELQKKYPVSLPEYAQLQDAINIYYFVDKLSDNLTKKDVILADAGSAFYIVRQAIKVKQGQRVLIASGTGAMGSNLPSSLGASLGLNAKRVICITGDGSLQTNIHELATIQFNNLPVKIFVLNNNGYVSIKNTQVNFFQNRQMGVDKQSGVSFPDLSKIADAYNIKYFKIKNNNELLNTISTVLAHKGPVICEVMCVQEQKIVPTVSTKKLYDGTLVSTSLDDMSPFLPKEEMDQIKIDLE